MIKRTLYFGNPAYLGMTNRQMVIRLPEVEKNESVDARFKKEATATIPIEDIGILIVDHKQVTVTQGLMSALMEENTAVIFCDSTHHPSGLVLPLDVHHVQQERFTAQISASEPLKKQLWQQTVIAKIRNQAELLNENGKDGERLEHIASKVRSGDPENCEGVAAHYYWGHIFPDSLVFTRDRNGDPPNNLLNYGYAILRALTARCLVGSGLLPTLGIHHSNRYNAYCLADDIMEPYRPFVDRLVLKIAQDKKEINELSSEMKKELLGIYSVDAFFDKERSPIMVGMQRTTASLAQCFEGSRRKIIFPEFNQR